MKTSPLQSQYIHENNGGGGKAVWVCEGGGGGLNCSHSGLHIGMRGNLTTGLVKA